MIKDGINKWQSIHTMDSIQWYKRRRQLFVSWLVKLMHMECSLESKCSGRTFKRTWICILRASCCHLEKLLEESQMETGRSVRMLYSYLRGRWGGLDLEVAVELMRSGWILRGEFKVGIHGLDVVPEGAEKQREDWRLTSGSQIGWAMTVLSELGRL